MSTPQPIETNPLLAPILNEIALKRDAKKGVVPPNRLLALLVILDALRDRSAPVGEDELYSYDYTLKNSRSEAIVRLLAKYQLPPKVGIGAEGVTVRGAPGLRVFRAIRGGEVIMARPAVERDALILEAVAVLAHEIRLFLDQSPVTLPDHVYAQPRTFIAALLAAVENRSQGRVEQALVGAKLQLAMPNEVVPDDTGFTPDKQTGRLADIRVGNAHYLVSVTPKDNHFKDAKSLADAGKQVMMIVSNKALSRSKKRLVADGFADRVSVVEIIDYVSANMIEIQSRLRIDAKGICLMLGTEYNRRIGRENDGSLRVVLPA